MGSFSGEAAAGTKGQTTRVWGKLQEPEKSRLASAEKRFGMTWNELHAYKDKMAFPVLPVQMGVGELANDISLCETIFRSLDRCLEQGKEHENPSQPYARMQICKPHWVQFNRCTKRRDTMIMRSIKTWEASYYGSLDAPSKTEYMDDLDTKMRYFLYAASHSLDIQKKRKLENNAQQCALRQMSLLNPRAAEETTSSSKGTTSV